jgi:type I restriction enzyme S subunit
MSSIKDLLREYCPNGVEYVAMGSLFNLRKGENLTHEMAVPGIYPVVTASRGSNFSHEDFNFDGEFITISSHGAYAGHISYFNQRFWLGNNVYLLEPIDQSVSVRFYWHILKSLASILVGTVNTGGIPYINAKDLLRLPLPKPPSEVQGAILEILDTFTALEESLEVELELRKSQYEYFRHKFLTEEKLGDGLKKYTLGEIAVKVTSGSTPLANSARFYESGTIPWLRTQEVKFNEVWATEVKVTEIALQETGIKWIPENCVIIAISGATAGRSAVNKIPLTTNQHCCNFQIDPEKADYRYVFHWVASNYEHIKSFGRGVRSDLSVSKLKDYPIELPSLDRQREISEFLDKFDQLTGDCSFGLPAEISSRKKQHEYYRTQLLKFEELDVS